jgi:DNA-binding transcriptional MerR regulator
MAKKSGSRIGEVCRELDLQPYVLRYWETEFPVLQAPAVAGTQRSYSEREVQVLRRIKRLLYEEGYTIAGAKKKLDGELAAGFTLGEAGGSRSSRSRARGAGESSTAVHEGVALQRRQRAGAADEHVRSELAALDNEGAGRSCRLGSQVS